MQLIFEHRLQEGIEVSNQSTLRLEHQNDDPDVFDEVEEPTPETYEEKDKVTTVAIDKFIEGEVTWRKTKPI